jgi:hypothetical protein
VQPDFNTLLALFDYYKASYPGHIKILLSQTDEEFDAGLEEVFEGAADFLERNANHLAPLGEEQISAVFVAYLTRPGLRALQEAHSNGHVDITIEAERIPPIRRRLGEAKIHDGPTYHVRGLEQLVSRYASGREGMGVVIEYVTKPKIKDLVTKIRAHLDSTKPCSQESESKDHRIRWAFTTDHQHSSGESFRVLHLNCNLHRPDKEVKKMR